MTDGMLHISRGYILHVHLGNQKKLDWMNVPEIGLYHGWNSDFVTVEPTVELVGSSVLRPVGWVFTSLFLRAFGSIALENRDGIKKIEIKRNV